MPKFFFAVRAFQMFLVAIPLTAQRGATAPLKCARIDTTASWYVAQRTWWQLDEKPEWTNDSLRRVLVDVARRIKAPHTGAFPIQLGLMNSSGFAAVPKADSAVVAQTQAMLRDMVSKQRSWPLRSIVGVAGERAAWIIAGSDSATAAAGIHRMMEAGPGESSPADVAVMEDWLRIQRGRKQIYGSQLVSLTGRAGSPVTWRQAPTEDLAHVDMRRGAAGLPPLALAKCLAARKN